MRKIIEIRMRLLLATITIFFYTISLSQEIPADSTILRIIFGKHTVDNINSDINIDNEDSRESIDSTTYLISFKENFKIDNQALLLVVCDAPIFVQQGNTWWYRNYYYLQNIKSTWKVIKSQTNGQEMLIGEVNEFEIVDIGQDKKALVSTFLNTSNNRYEKGIFFYELAKDSIVYLLNIDLAYSNEKINEGVSENENCLASSFENRYEIEKSDKKWFDIKVHRINYGYIKGCKQRVVNSEEGFSYIHDGVKYIERKSGRVKF